ncbi:hypothetical protein [Flavobacterium sp. LAR06]|uniref:hypothetical protein n=1 Tax=Flavobacterium sp. LAR06 TaxID=3064897 RepID=UPI0035C24124
MRFKQYNQQQRSFYVYWLDDLIREKHPVRMVDQVVDPINIPSLLKACSKESTPGYHPKMLLKRMLYAYMTNVYYIIHQNSTYTKTLASDLEDFEQTFVNNI